MVVGRISTVDAKRWKVDIKAQRDAVLQLNSINLPGGVQRMKTYEDQLAMRTLFQEHDLVSAEVQSINADGVISLHSRSLKYGKLENGQLVIVPSSLVRRLPQHYVSLPNGVDVILGKNGYIWITRSIPDSWKHESEDMLDEITPLAETLQRIRAKHCDTPLTMEERLKVVHVRNCILALSSCNSGADYGEESISISPESIMSVFQKSVELKMQPKVTNLCSMLLSVRQ